MKKTQPEWIQYMMEGLKESANSWNWVKNMLYISMFIIALFLLLMMLV